jgi:alanine dehydrogenase
MSTSAPAWRSIHDTAQLVAESDLIVKVKEPRPVEIERLNERHTFLRTRISRQKSG